MARGFNTNEGSSHRPVWRDIVGIVVFVGLVALGTLFINNFVFRSFSVVGPSMESTLYTGDKLIVNRVSPTTARLFGGTYTPKRGQVIVFKNPKFEEFGGNEEYIVKRVIGFAGERVTVKDGTVRVYNASNPNGFNPDDLTKGPGSPTSGDVDETVPDGTIFVMGDHRVGTYSLDSRNGLGPIPLYDVIGPVEVRFFPFTGIRTF